MANETESRVVELQFNNRQFEANVSQTLKTLDNLKESLKFEGAEQGFKDLDAAADKLDLSKLDANVEKLANRFTILGTAADLVRNKIVGVADSMISTTASTLTSFSAVANLGSAWDQYAEKTSSVQTIMAATRQEFAETGNQMEIVESELDKLTWFTDETSHKFLDLVNNIGKFTSNNIGLHSAVDEMMGIATWASISGANTTEAARAMYNLSQAMSMGALTLNDWKSIENANMATVEFKQTAIDTAVELGTLTKVTDGVYRAMNGAEVTVEKFRDTLTDSKWLDNNVLEATLSKYGGFATKLNNLYETLNQSGTVYTSTLLDMIEAEKTGADYTEEFNQVLEATGINAEELRGAIEMLASEENDLGYRAFKASQETKTFGEAIDYVRTAVTSGWAQSFETVFGNYEEAKALWTGFADVLYDIFVASGETRNAILDLWKAAGGRDALFGTEEMTGILQNLAAAFETIIGPAKAAWENIFPPLSLRDTAAYLLGFTEWLRDLTEQFGLSEEAGRGLEIVLTGLLSPLKLVTFLLRMGATGAFYLFTAITSLVDKVLSFIAAIYDGTISLADFVAGSTAAKVAIALLGFAAGIALSPIIALGYGILKLLDYTSNFDSFGDWLNQMRAAHPVINTVVGVIERFVNAVINIPSTLRNVASSFVDFLSQFDSWGAFFAGLTMAFVGFGKNIVQGLIIGIGSGVSWAVSAIVNVFTALKTAFMSAAGIHSPSIVFMAFGILIIAGLVIGILSALAEVFAAGGSIGDALISGFSKKNVVATFKLIADGIITIVKGVIFVLAAIPYAIYLGVRAFIDFIRGTDTLKASLSNAQGVFSRFGQKLLEIFSIIGDIGSKTLDKLRQFLEPVNNFFKRFFDNLTAGQIVVFAISVALITLSVSISRLLKGFNDLGPAVTGLVKSLSGLVKSLSAVPRAFAAMKRAAAFRTYAVSIAILAGSLIILAGACSGDNMENIIRAGKALGILAAGILAFSAVLALITKISSEMPKFSFAILGLAVAVGILSRVFSEIQGIKTTLDGVISFLFMCTIMIGMMWAIDKTIDHALSGGVSMLLLAMSIKTLCSAFIDLNKELKELGSGAELWESIGAFAAICIALGALMLAMSSVDVKSGIGALAGILALKMIISILADLNESVKGLTAENAWGQLLVLLPTILEIGAFLLLIAVSLKLAGNALLTAGIGMLAGIFALKMALSTFANMTQEELQQALPGIELLGSFLARLGIGLAALIAVWGVLTSIWVQADFAGFGRSMISLSIAVGILIGCMKLMESLDPSTIELFAGTLEGLMVFMGIAVLLAGLAEDAHKGINAIRNFMIAFVACVAILTLFQTRDGNELLMPMLSICFGLISLAIALLAASKLTEKVKMAPIIAMLVGMTLLSATLVLLSRQPWENVAASGAAMTAALLAFAHVLKVLSDMGAMNWKEVLTTVFLLISVMVAIAASVASLLILSSVPWESLIASAASLVAMLLTMGSVCKTLAGLGSNAVNAVIGAAAMTILAVDLLGMALALQMLNGLDMTMMLVSAGTLAGMLIVMGVVCRILGGLGSNAAAAIVGAAAMTILVVDILGLVYALQMLNGLDMTAMLISAGVLAVLLGVMGVICVLLGGLASTAVMAVVGAAAMTILAVDLMIMTVALSMLNTLDMNSMAASVLALGVLIAEMAVIIIVLSGLGPMIAMAIFGVISMTILAADMVIMAVALSMLNGLDMNALVTSAVVLGGLMLALGVVIGILSLLGPMILTAIPAAIAMTILAADLLIVAQALSMLNGLDMEAMQQSAISLAIVMGAMVGVVVVLGVIGALSAAAIAGAVAMTILSADLVIIAQALAIIGAYDPAMIQQAATTMLGTITALVGVSVLLAGVSPAALAGAATLLAMAVALKSIGQACITFSAQSATIDKDMQRLVDAIGKIGNLDKEGPKKAKDAIKGIQEALSSAIDVMVIVITPKMTAAGGYFVEGLVNGISIASASVYAAGYGLGDSLYEGVANRLVINSPSAIGQWLGQMFGLGTAQGAASMASANYTAGAIDGASAAQGAASMAPANETAGQLDGASVASGVDSQQGAAYSAGGNVGYQAAAGANAQTPAAASAGNNLGSSLWNAFMSWVNKIKAGLQKLGAALSGTEIGQKALEEVNKVTSAFNSIGDGGGGNGLSNFIDGAKNKLQSLADDVLNTDDLLSGLKDTLGDMPSGGGGGSPGGGGGSSGGSGGGSGGSSAVEEEEDAAANLIVTLDELNDKEKKFAEMVANTTSELEAGAISQEEWNKSINDGIENLEIESGWLQDLVYRYQEGSIGAAEFNSELQEISKSVRSQTVKEWIGELTALYKEGKLSIDEYNMRVDEIISKSEEETRTIEELNEALQNGTIKLDEYNQARAKLIDQATAKAQATRYLVIKNSIDLLTDSLNKGEISQEVYNSEVQKLLDSRDKETRTLEELNIALQAGTLSLDDYSSAFSKVIQQNKEAEEQAKEDALKKAILGIGLSYEYTTEKMVTNEKALLELVEAYKAGTITLEEYNSALKNLMGDSITVTQSMEEEMNALTDGLHSGAITVEEYYAAIAKLIGQSSSEVEVLNRLRQSFIDGKISITEYNAALEVLNQQLGSGTEIDSNLVMQVSALQDQLISGQLTLSQYSIAVQNAIDSADKEIRTLEELSTQLKAGEITTSEYADAVAKLAAQEEAEIALSNGEGIYNLRKRYDAGEISLNEYVVALNALIEKSEEEKRTMEELDYLYDNNIISRREYLDALNAINDQEKKRKQEEIDASTKASMAAITESYVNGKMSIDAYNIAIQKAIENADRETRSIEELKRALDSGVIDANEFANAIKKIAQQEADAKQEAIDDSVKKQIHAIYVEFENGAISEEEYLDGVDKIIRMSKQERRTLKELDYQLQNNIITYDEYKSAVDSIFEAQNDVTISLKEMMEQEKQAGKRSTEFAKILRAITIDTWGFSDSLLDVSTVLRFAGKTFLNFYDAASNNGGLLEALGITDYVNTTDGAIKATEELMLDFYKMQNPTDLAIQGFEDLAEIGVDKLEELKAAWDDYVQTSYNAIMGTYDVFNAPGWFEKPILAPDKLLENQQMYIDGEESFVEKMMDLAGKLDSEMWMSLYQGGSANLEQVIAFWQMTDEEIAAFNAGQERLRDVARENAEKLAAISVMVYGEKGYDAIQAFVDGTADAVDIPTIENEALAIGEEIGETMADGVKSKFTDDILKMSFGTIRELYRRGGITFDQAVELIFAHDPGDILLSDYSIDESMLNEIGVKFVQAVFDGTKEEIEEAHENLFSGVAAITTADTDLAFSSGDAIGEYFDKGIAGAVECYIDYAVTAVEKLADAMIEALEKKIKDAQSSLGSLGGGGSSGGGSGIPLGPAAIGGSMEGWKGLNEAIGGAADRASEMADAVETAIKNINDVKNTQINNTVNLNQNIDAQPSDAYIIAQETGNTTRGIFRSQGTSTNPIAKHIS